MSTLLPLFIIYIMMLNSKKIVSMLLSTKFACNCSKTWAIIYECHVFLRRKLIFCQLQYHNIEMCPLCYFYVNSVTVHVDSVTIKSTLLPTSLLILIEVWHTECYKVKLNTLTKYRFQLEVELLNWLVTVCKQKYGKICQLRYCYVNSGTNIFIDFNWLGHTKCFKVKFKIKYSN